jgi:hypothetical protein
LYKEVLANYCATNKIKKSSQNAPFIKKFKSLSTNLQKIRAKCQDKKTTKRPNHLEEINLEDKKFINTVDDERHLLFDLKGTH